MVPYLPVVFEQALSLTSAGVVLEGTKKREQFTYPLYPLRVNEIFIYRPDAEMCQRYELIDLYQANFLESPFTQIIFF